MTPGIELAGKRVLVVGLARTGIATSLFCAARGARVTASEARTESSFGETVSLLRAVGVTLELDGHHEHTFLQQDLIVPSPGVPLRLPGLVTARKAGIPIWSEIELASRFLAGQLVCVTGSNGKTTTTALLGHILKTAGRNVQVAGNIGTPLISVVDGSSDLGFTVVEASSFQLEAIEEFRPDVALLLNLTPDHLDRHASFEEYARAKARIFENQTRNDAAVLNEEDAVVAKYAPARPQVYWFSRQHRVDSGCFLQGDEIVFRGDGFDSAVLCRSDIRLRGNHNLENVLAAATAAMVCDLEPRAIAAGVRTFAGVEHRIEFVANIAGVAYFNDSKATNVDATLKAIDAFDSNLIVILGGKDKGSDYTPLREPLRKRAKLVLLIGAASEKIESELGQVVPIEHADTLANAIELAAKSAKPGDTVLLAPACASFDQFQNYEHRGRVFKELVRELQEHSTAADAARKV